MFIVYAILRTHDVYLYKSLKPSSCKVGGGGGCMCEIWIVRTNNKLLGGRDEQVGHKISVSRERPQSTREQGQDGHIREVLQGIAAQAYINVYKKLWCSWFIGKEKRPKIQYVGSMSSLFIFPQVKNKPCLPWVYSWIRHCCEQIEYMHCSLF